MPPDALRHARLKELVYQASRFSGAQRSALLDRECGGDDELRREVLSILESQVPTNELLSPHQHETAGHSREARVVELPARVGAYRLGRELGRGGMGMVFEGTDERTGEHVAVKILHPGLVQGDGSVERFVREARVGSSITHGGVVRTLDAGSTRHEGHVLHWLVMEYVEGRTLRALLRDLGAVPERLVREIGRQCAAALTAIHAAGVVHRDLKPENVLITDDQRIRIMDLGVAKIAAGSVNLTRAGQFLGSVSHAAPEQIEGRDVGPAADLYSLGVTLHELVSGRNPFLREGVGATIRAHLDSAPPSLGGVSPFLAEVVATLLQKSPSRRFTGADELQRALAEGEAGPWWRARTSGRAGSPVRIPVPRASGLVGRAREMDALLAAWRAAQAGQGAGVLLTGEAGIGKTRLLAEIADAAASDGALVLHSPLQRADGACPFGAALAEALGTGARDDVRRRLERWPALAEAASDLIAGGSCSDSVTTETIGSAFSRWLQSVSAERSVAWLLDDVSGAPSEGVAIARALAASAAGRRAMVVIAGRADGDVTWTQSFAGLPALVRVEPERLHRRDVETLVEQVLGSGEPAHRLASPLAQRSDGVPGFALDLLRGLQDRGDLRKDAAGSWRIDGEARHLDLPAAAREAGLARLASIQRDAREVLDAAAVQGLLFDAELVAEQLGRPLVRVLQELADLERRHELVRSEGRLHAFDGRVLLDVIVEEMPEMLLRAHHAELARALERRLPAGRLPDGRESAEIASHHLRGHRPENAVPHLRRALEHLAQHNMHRETVEMGEAALRIADPLPTADRAVVLLRLAHALGILGRREEERAAGELALHLAETLGEPSLLADACLAKGLQHFAIAQTEESVVWLRKAAEIAREAGDARAELRASRNLATAVGRLGRLDEAIELHEQTREKARELGDLLSESMSRVNLGSIRISRGELDAALQHYREGADLARRAGDVRIEAHAEGGLGLTLLYLGRRDESHAHALKQAELSREIGDRRSESLGTGTAGLASMERGRYAEALSLLTRAHELTQANRDPRGMSISGGNLGSVRAALGDLAGAEPLLREALESSRQQRQPLVEAAHLLRWAQWHEVAGDPEGMLRTAREAQPLFERVKDPEGRANAVLLQGMALLHLGNVSEAIERLGLACELAEPLPVPSIHVLATLLRSAQPGGDVEEAIALLKRQEARIGVPDRLLARRAAWKATGDAMHLARAHELLETLCAHAPPGFRESLVERIPARAEIARAWRAGGAGG